MSKKAKKVLIVDEEPDMRQFVQAALEEDGYQLIFATNGQEGVEKARAESPDLIVMDVQMPKKDGLSALYDLRQDPDTKAIPVVFLTGIAERTGVHFSAKTVEEYMGERPDAFLDKPVAPEQLRQTVQQLLAR